MCPLYTVVGAIGPEYFSRCSDSPRDGRIENLILAAAIFSGPVQKVPVAYPASYTMGTRSFPGVKRPRRDFDLLHL